MALWQSLERGRGAFGNARPFWETEMRQPKGLAATFPAPNGMGPACWRGRLSLRVPARPPDWIG